MVAANIMAKDIAVLTGEQTILDAIKLMRGSNIRQIPVIDNDMKVLGVITQREMLKAVFTTGVSDEAEGLPGGGGGGLPRFFGHIDSMASVALSPALKRGFASVAPDAPLLEVAGLLHSDSSVEGVLVLDNEGRLLGVITPGEIFTRLCEYLETKREKRR